MGGLESGGTIVLQRCSKLRTRLEDLTKKFTTERLDTEPWGRTSVKTSGGSIHPANRGICIALYVRQCYGYTTGTKSENCEAIMSMKISPSILQFLFKVFLERGVHDLVTNRFADLLQVAS